MGVTIFAPWAPFNRGIVRAYLSWPLYLIRFGAQRPLQTATVRNWVLQNMLERQRWPDFPQHATPSLPLIVSSCPTVGEEKGGGEGAGQEVATECYQVDLGQRGQPSRYWAPLPTQWDTTYGGDKHKVTTSEKVNKTMGAWATAVSKQQRGAKGSKDPT